MLMMRHVVSKCYRFYLGNTPDLHGTRGLISWSGSTMAYT